MDDKLKSLTDYLNLLNEKNKPERLTGATVVLEMLGYDIQYDMFSDKYKVKKM